MTNEQILRDAAQQDERLEFAIMEHLGPAALTGGKMSVLEAFELGWKAALAQPATAQAEQVKPVVVAWLYRDRPSRDFEHLAVTTDRNVLSDVCTEYIFPLCRIDSLATPQPQPAIPAQTSEAQAYTSGHCTYRAAKGGCQLHNLQCGYPNCDRKPTPQHTNAAPPIPAGHVVVPVELTEAMETVLFNLLTGANTVSDTYKYLIAAAAPIQPAQEQANELSDEQLGKIYQSVFQSWPGIARSAPRPHPMVIAYGRAVLDSISPQPAQRDSKDAAFAEAAAACWMSAQTIRLHAGELTSNEMRAVQAVLTFVQSKINSLKSDAAIAATQEQPK